jgi:hypothetical protein
MEKAIGRSLTPELFYEYPTINQLARYLEEQPTAVARQRRGDLPQAAAAETDQPDYTECTLETFMQGADPALSEMARFNQWLHAAVEGGKPIFEAPHLGANHTAVDIQRPHGERLRVLNFCGYNYLGYSRHPVVITAAKQALDVYGLGTNATPIVGGTWQYIGHWKRNSWPSWTWTIMVWRSALLVLARTPASCPLLSSRVGTWY